MQNNSIIIYFNNNFNKIADIEFPEEEKNLITFSLIDDNILIILNSLKIYFVSFEKKQLVITMVIEYKYLKEKFNINLINDDNNSQSISFREITYMKDFDIIFTSGNIVCSWELNKKKKN